MFPHLTEVSPSGASKFGIRIVYNSALDLLFVGCSITERCLTVPSVLMPDDYDEAVNKTWICNVCEAKYIVRVPGLDDTFQGPKNGRPLDRWVAGFLGYDTDDVDVWVT